MNKNSFTNPCYKGLLLRIFSCIFWKSCIFRGAVVKIPLRPCLEMYSLKPYSQTLMSHTIVTGPIVWIERAREECLFWVVVEIFTDVLISTAAACWWLFPDYSYSGRRRSPSMEQYRQYCLLSIITHQRLVLIELTVYVLR